ncbi:CKLF-like MARVEL transmembrane domain-containing protein 6 [Bienertia sinuspersici]
MLLQMKFLDWYVKIAVGSAIIGASMEFFMIKTGFCAELLALALSLAVKDGLGYDKVTVLESEKRAWENSPEAQVVREALNPWRHVATKETKDH